MRLGAEGRRAGVLADKLRVDDTADGWVAADDDHAVLFVIQDFAVKDAVDIVVQIRAVRGGLYVAEGLGVSTLRLHQCVD